MEVFGINHNFHGMSLFEAIIDSIRLVSSYFITFFPVVVVATITSGSIAFASALIATVACTTTAAQFSLCKNVDRINESILSPNFNARLTTHYSA